MYEITSKADLLLATRMHLPLLPKAPRGHRLWTVSTKRSPGIASRKYQLRNSKTASKSAFNWKIDKNSSRKIRFNVFIFTFFSSLVSPLPHTGLGNRSRLRRECDRKLHPRGGHEEANRFRNSIGLGRGLHIGRFGLWDEELLRVSNHRNRSR